MVTSTELIDRALALAGACDRPDLQRRLGLVRDRAVAPTVRVLVVGEPKQGKSSLVNALVGAPVCAVAADVATVVPVVVRGGDEPSAELLLADAATSPQDAGAPPAVERLSVPIHTVAARVGRGADGQDRLLSAEVRLPRRLLAGGLEIVDTPGVGGVGAASSLVTMDLLPTADAVVVVSDASQEFTAPEMAFLQRAAALCPTVVCVLTKIDVNPAWRTILELDRAHLAEQGVDAPVLAVSSTLAALALTSRDAELHEESGLGALTEHLRREVVDRAGALAARALRHDLTSVAEQLRLAVRAELTTLEDPAGRERVLRELEDARKAVEDLRRRSARWQQVLNDGVTDLMADIDYDLRDRTRVVTREAEEAIDAQDPGPVWPQLAGWLDERVGAAVADSFVWAEQRSQWLAEQVVEQFARDGGAALPELSVGSSTEALEMVVEVAAIDDGAMSVRERMLVGLRGSYTGVLMTGLVTSLVGLAIINPLSLAAGVLMGRRAYKDDKAARTARRQSEAKAVVRRHLDEVVFQVGKQLKDRLRLVQRTLRDLMSDTVDEMSQSLGDAVKAAQQSTRTVSEEREARARVLRLRLAELDRLTADVGRSGAEPVAAR